MNYQSPGGYFSDINKKPYLDVSDDYCEILIGSITVNFYDSEIYKNAAMTFILYLEEKQKDSDWLMINQDLIIDLFNLLIQSFESGNLLPAIKLLEDDPEFSEILANNIRTLLMHQNIAA
jgi:hypothetical protein